ncbi:MAG: sigma-70 family RNA polymerase sigma factor [Phycisphaera sp.]|nr:sigma-70 family RNA polymerase sigma factor [Phycisphaera sp.]
MNEADTRQLVLDLTQMQTRLRAFVMSLLGSVDATEEVVQETNVVIWSKREEFKAGTNFNAWAFQIARFQVMAYRKRRARDRHEFSDALVERLGDKATRRAGAVDERREALRRCMDKLPVPQRQLIDSAYAGHESVVDIAERTGRAKTSLYQMLYRIRRTLMTCVEQTLGAEGTP